MSRLMRHAAVDPPHRLVVVVEDDATLRELDSWRGNAAIERAMEHQGFDLQLTRYDAHGWRATFYPTGCKHSATRFTASELELLAGCCRLVPAHGRFRGELATQEIDWPAVLERRGG